MDILITRVIAIFVLIIAMSMAFSLAVVADEAEILRRNMTGERVTELQRMLDYLGYDLAADGRFGGKTENLVRSFQQDNGLVADGRVGPETWRALYAANQNQVHRVQRGDSLIALARTYGSTVADIMGANDLTDDTIYIGQKLIIPKVVMNKVAGEKAESPSGETSKGTPVMMTYQVQAGESAYVLAKRFNTTVLDIAKANSLANPALLRVGQRLLIPSEGKGAVVESFWWPVTGRISSGYGWRIHPIYKNRQFHGGIDIAVPTGTSVRAAASGIVIRADDMDGFGLGVVIDHGNGVTTWYGHNSALLVKKGNRVVRGQEISKSGSTGASTGPHLDFRIKIDGNTVNPIYWLP